VEGHLPDPSAWRVSIEARIAGLNVLASINTDPALLAQIQRSIEELERRIHDVPNSDDGPVPARALPFRSTVSA
jgi:hypothetical protein